MFPKETSHRTGLGHRYRGNVTSCEKALYYINFTANRERKYLELPLNTQLFEGNKEALPL